jgi:hypothetical protein
VVSWAGLLVNKEWLEEHLGTPEALGAGCDDVTISHSNVFYSSGHFDAAFISVSTASAM